MANHNALFYIGTRLRLAAAIRKAGKSRSEVNDLISDVSDDVIDATTEAVAASPETPFPVGAGLVGGPIIDAILAFLNGPGGAALIAALLKLLGL